MDSETISIVEANGGRVVPRIRYIVVDRGERGNSRDVAGLDDKGVPMDCNSFCVIPTYAVKVYYSDSMPVLMSKMRSKNSDISIGKIDDTDDIETAAAAGRVNNQKEMKDGMQRG